MENVLKIYLDKEYSLLDKEYSLKVNEKIPIDLSKNRKATVKLLDFIKNFCKKTPPSLRWR